MWQWEAFYHQSHRWHCCSFIASDLVVLFRRVGGFLLTIAIIQALAFWWAWAYYTHMPGSTLPVWWHAETSPPHCCVWLDFYPNLPRWPRLCGHSTWWWRAWLTVFPHNPILELHHQYNDLMTCILVVWYCWDYSPVLVVAFTEALLLFSLHYPRPSRLWWRGMTLMCDSEWNPIPEEEERHYSVPFYTSYLSPDRPWWPILLPLICWKTVWLLPVWCDRKEGDGDDSHPDMKIQCHHTTHLMTVTFFVGDCYFVVLYNFLFRWKFLKLFPYCNCAIPCSVPWHFNCYSVTYRLPEAVV